MIIGIILLVLANTILMAARERTREYAVLKTLGFQARHIAGFIIGESLLIALCGGLLGLALTFPVVRAFGMALRGFFPIIRVEPTTIALALCAALLRVSSGGPAHAAGHSHADRRRPPDDRLGWNDEDSFFLHLAESVGAPPHDRYSPSAESRW